MYNNCVLFGRIIGEDLCAVSVQSWHVALGVARWSSGCVNHCGVQYVLPLVSSRPRRFVVVCSVAFASYCVGTRWVRAWFARTCRWFCSWAVDRVSTTGDLHVRRLFNERLVIRNPRLTSGHSHPLAAADRTASSRAIDEWARSLGKEVYTVSRSNRDHRLGQRLYYHTKDLAMPVTNHAIPSNSIIKMVDVDYYADMDYWLSFGKPLAIYTFVPETAGGRVLDGTFSIVNDQVTTRVNGGATYKHNLWDYSHDWLTVDTMLGKWVCSVDQVRSPIPGSNRRIVFINPVRWVPIGFSRLVQSMPLKRLKMSYGNVNVLRVVSDTGELSLSMAVSGQNSSVTLPADLFSSVQTRFRLSKYKNISDIERYFVQEKFDKPYIPAALLFELLEGGMELPELPSVVSCGARDYAIHYQSIKGLVTEDGRDYARMLSGPVVNWPAVIPTRSCNNDAACVAGRVTTIANKVVPHGLYNQFAFEFVDLLVGSLKCSPWEVSRVIETQNRPAQRARSAVALLWLGVKSFFVKAFQKKEAYNKVTDPRNISSCPTDHTLRLSCFTYPFKEHVLKRAHWYVPGSTPDQIEERISAIAMGAPCLFSTDFSRLDGTISKWLREHVEQAAYARAFSSNCELLVLLNNEYNATARTEHGVHYDPGYSRLSGSPLTTDGNTIICAFWEYCVLRRLGLSVEDAYLRIGPKYGDDGLSACITVERAEKTAANLGLKVKISKAYPGQPVAFLGRVFVDPWTTQTSIQDPVRTLKKIHLTMTSDGECPLAIAAVNKAKGYLSIDARTPLISHYCRLLLRSYDEDDHISTMIDQGITVIEKDVPWHARQGKGWLQRLEDESLMLKVMAGELGTTVDEVLTLCKAIDDCKQISEMPTKVRPIHKPLEITIPAVVAGEVMLGASVEPVVPPVRVRMPYQPAPPSPYEPHSPPLPPEELGRQSRGRIRRAFPSPESPPRRGPAGYRGPARIRRDRRHRAVVHPRRASQ